MKVGILGVPTSGKSCLFNALTRGHAETGSFGSGRTGIHRGRILVPDERLDWLTEQYHPKKKTPAAVDFLDLPGIAPGSTDKGTPALIADLRTVDALLQVVRVFDDPAIPHPEGTIDPVRDARDLEAELLLADLAVVEKRLERIASDLGKGVEKSRREEEKRILEPIRDALEEGKPVRSLGLSGDQEERIRGYALLTLKPMIAVGNVSEGEMAGGESDAALRDHARVAGMPYVRVSARIESEISEMEEDEAGEFLEDMGVTELSRDRVVRAAFDALSLISFFTFGDDECRTWTVPRGATAVEAAGKIHSDIARGFIRAEVVDFDTFRSAGSWSAAKEGGKHRLEGKEYRMQDGDCVIFRFSV